MSPQDPLEQLLAGAFNRELRQIESNVTVDRVMARVKRSIGLRRIMLTIAVVASFVMLIATLPDVLWLIDWLGQIRIANLAIPAALPLLGLFLPWLLALLDDQV